MTPASRLTILAGITLFTLGTIIWILTTTWQWFAGGAAIFLGCLIAGGVLSVEVKHPQRNTQETYREPQNHDTEETSPSSGEEASQTWRIAGEDMWGENPQRG